MSEGNFIAEIERPHDERQWNFFVMIDGDPVPIVVGFENGRKCLCVASQPAAIFRLPEMRRERALGWGV
jgi:hypothetical protein